jgi:hypothetical protein
MKDSKLHEAAKEYARDHSKAPDKETPDWIINDFIAGAKWQASQFTASTPERSAEEVLNHELVKENLHPNALSSRMRRSCIKAMEYYRSLSSNGEDKFVYGINGGCCYEGGGVWGDLYATEELARQRFEAILNEKIAERERHNKWKHDRGEDDDDDKWTRREGHGTFIEDWSDGYDYVAIQKMKVLSTH